MRIKKYIKIQKINVFVRQRMYLFAEQLLWRPLLINKLHVPGAPTYAKPIL